MGTDPFRPEEFERIFGFPLSKFTADGKDLNSRVVEQINKIKNKFHRQDATNRIFASISVEQRYRYRFGYWGWRCVKAMLLSLFFDLTLSFKPKGDLRMALVALVLCSLAGATACFFISMFNLAKYLRAMMARRRT
jgi:hypothetical protein